MKDIQIFGQDSLGSLDLGSFTISPHAVDCGLPAAAVTVCAEAEKAKAKTENANT